MSSSSAGAHAVAAACMLAALVGGCRSTEHTSVKADAAPATRSSAALRRVPLPDLTRVTESARQQILDRHRSLTLKAADAGTSADDLGNASGELGKLVLAAEYFDVAEACFLNAQALMPHDMRWPYYLGHVYRAKSDPQQSAAAFEQSLRLRPDYVPALIQLGSSDLDRDRLDDAKERFEKALSVEPYLSAAELGLGRIALAKKAYGEAVAHLERALRADPQATAIHVPLAMAYHGLGDQQRADVHLRQRGNRTPRTPDPLMDDAAGQLQSAAAFETRGIEALDRQDWASAAAAFRQGIDIASTDVSLGASLRQRLGTALYMAGDMRGALEQFDEALKLSPQLPPAQHSMGLLMVAGGRQQEAIAHFSAAVTNDPNYLEARLGLADALRRAGRVTEALLHYRAAMGRDPRFARARFGYAIGLARIRRYQEARDALAEGLAVQPDHLELAHALARLLATAPDERLRDGARALAITDAMVSQQKGAPTFEIMETRAMALAELNRYGEAAALQGQLVAQAERTGQRDLARRLTDNLRRYERGEPCRTPWADDDPIHAPGPPPDPVVAKLLRTFHSDR